MAIWKRCEIGYEVLNPQNRSLLMGWSRENWLNLIAAGLITTVFIIVIGEEVFGLFFQKPIGGILTIMTVGILGYIYFSK
jgi:hypothetical protein